MQDVTERPNLNGIPLSLSPSPDDMPIIDFSKLTKGNKEETHEEILKLSTACEEWGFFQVN